MPLSGAGPAVGSRLGFDGQEKDKIGARKPMLHIQQGRAAYGQLWTSRNLSVIPLGTDYMDASLPLWIANRLLTALRRASRALPCAEGSRVWSRGQGEGESCPAFPGCQSRARPHFGAVGPSGGTVYTSDLKSAAERLTGSSPVLGTTTRNRPHGWCGLSSRCRDK